MASSTIVVQVDDRAVQRFAQLARRVEAAAAVLRVEMGAVEVLAAAFMFSLGVCVGLAFGVALGQ
jgi:hypothetical protein